MRRTTLTAVLVAAAFGLVAGVVGCGRSESTTVSAAPSPGRWDKDAGVRTAPTGRSGTAPTYRSRTVPTGRVGTARR